MSSAPPYIDARDVDAKLSWRAAVAALRDGHQRPRPQIGDLLFEQKVGGFLNRAAWVAGVGLGVKSVTIFPGNAAAAPLRPTVQGVFLLFDDASGELKASIDGALITKWKTAADSALGAQLLANPAPRRLLAAGAGAAARALIDAYIEIFPTIERIDIWARRPQAARVLAQEFACRNIAVSPVEDVAAAVGQADIVTCATAAREPIVHGDWVRPGTHVDLVGAYGPDMREGDDALLHKSRIFVDCRETTVSHIGELKIPIEAGVISPASIGGDLYDLVNGSCARESAEEITLYKNGGGAHLDLMIAEMIFRAFKRQPA